MMQGQDVEFEWKQESIESGAVNVSRPVLPPKAKLIKDYEFVKQLDKKSFHSISKYIRMTPDAVTGYYFKEGSKKSIRSVLEAISAGFSSLIAPEHTAATWAVYNDEYRCMGVLSEEIPNFIPASSARLKSSDIAPLPLKDILILEELYEEYMVLEKRRDALRKKEIKIDRIKEMIRDYTRSDECTDEQADVAYSDMKMLMGEEGANFFAQADVTKQINAFYKKINQEYELSKEQFNSYRIVKGCGIAFVSAIVNQDADFHYNNFTNYGVRFDFDMTLWPILFDYKEDYTKYLRAPRDDMFLLTVRDIAHFPNVADALPYYWPTFATPNFSNDYLKVWVPEFSFSQNSYPKTEIENYRNLETNEVFIWHKFATLLRYLLTTTELYRIVISQHLVESPQRLGTIFRLLENQEKQQNHLMNVLVRVPGFKEFYQQYGDYVMTKHIADLRKEYEFDEEQVHEQYSRVGLLLENIVGVEFQVFKGQVIQKMKDYFNSTRSIFRTNQSLSQEICSFCGNLSADSLDSAAILRDMNCLYDYLKASRDGLKSKGEMFRVLDELIPRLRGLMQLAHQRAEAQQKLAANI